MQELSARSNPRHLRVSVTPSFAARWLLPRMARFVATHPDIDLDVRASEINVDFQRDDADCAVRYGLGNWPGVVSEHLLDERFLPVCSPRLANGRLPKQPGGSRALSRCCAPNDEYWQPWFAAAGLDWPEPDRGPIFNDSSHMLQAAIDGHGIALARTSLLGYDVRNGLLVRLFDVEVPSVAQYYFVHPARAADSAKIAAFRQWLRDGIARDDEGVNPASDARSRGARSVGGERRQRRDAHAEEADAPLERHALQALARRAPDRLRILRRVLDRAIARDRLEVVEAQLDADRPADVALAREIAGEAHAQIGEDLRQLGAIAAHRQVAIERGLAADRLRLALGDHVARRPRRARLVTATRRSCGRSAR